MILDAPTERSSERSLSPWAETVEHAVFVALPAAVVVVAAAVVVVVVAVVVVAVDP